MIIRTFISEDCAAITDIHSSQNIVWPEQPHTPEARERADRNRNPQNPFQRWVAAEASRVVDFATYSSGLGGCTPGWRFVHAAQLR
jgi:L-amino acid N-acyltransferase YncA